MKPYRNSIVSAIWAFIIFLLTVGDLFAQEKHRVRVSLSYIAEMPNTSKVALQARFRGEDGFEPASRLTFDIFNVYPNDSLIAVGSKTTDNMGKAMFDLPDLNSQYRDSLGSFTYRVIHREHVSYQPVERDISFKRSQLDAYLVEEAGISQLKVTLTDLHSGEPVADRPLEVGVQRLFGMLKIGGDFHLTDDTGSVLVPIENDIPGLHGKLMLEARLMDDDDFGTVHSRVEAPIGVPIVDTSTFDQRTMWSPPSKTPLFWLTIPNLMIIAVWGAIVFLIVNLYKISKVNNKES